MSLYRGVPSFQGADSSTVPALKPELKSLGRAQSVLAPQLALRSFNTRVQEYGEWLSGFEWNIIGCVTYARKRSKQSATAAFTRYLHELEKSIKSRIAYIAVPEHRTSGCGRPPIPLHWHFLIGCPPHKAGLLTGNCSALWKRNGISHIDVYERDGNGVFYIMKTANNIDFEFWFDNLHRMSNSGSDDLALQMACNDYVPEHAKWHTELETLTLRERGGQ